MRRLLPLAVGLVLGSAPGAGVLAQEAAPVDAGPGVLGEAPIAAGNTATARERALDEAFRKLVEATFTALLAETGTATPNAAQAGVRASWLQRPRRLVRNYRVLEESEQGGVLRVRVTADLDEAGMRRELERSRGPMAPRTAPAGAIPVIALGSPEAAIAVGSALATGGVRAEVMPGRFPDPNAGKPLAQKSGRGVAIAVNGREEPEGAVRGAGVQAVACEVAVRLVPVEGDPSSERAAKSRAFHSEPAQARDTCFARAVSALLPALLPELGGLATGAGDLRSVFLDLDLIEPAALAPVLRAIRKIAGSSAAEVRRIAVGRAEIAVSTRLAPAALLGGLARELGAVATITRTGPDRGDRILAQVRLLPPPLPPASAAPPGPVAPAAAVASPPQGPAAPRPQ